MVVFVGDRAWGDAQRSQVAEFQAPGRRIRTALIGVPSEKEKVGFDDSAAGFTSIDEHVMPVSSRNCSAPSAQQPTIWARSPNGRIWISGLTLHR